MKYVASPFVRRSVFEEMRKPNIMFLISSIENLAKIIMDSVKNYVRQCTNHVREDIKNI